VHLAAACGAGSCWVKLKCRTTPSHDPAARASPQPTTPCAVPLLARSFHQWTKFRSTASSFRLAAMHLAECSGSNVRVQGERQVALEVHLNVLHRAGRGQQGCRGGSCGSSGSGRSSRSCGGTRGGSGGAHGTQRQSEQPARSRDTIMPPPTPLPPPHPHPPRPLPRGRRAAPRPSRWSACCQPWGWWDRWRSGPVGRRCRAPARCARTPPCVGQCVCVCVCGRGGGGGIGKWKHESARAWSIDPRWRDQFPC
jgi:hypothetical protein